MDDEKRGPGAWRNDETILPREWHLLYQLGGYETIAPDARARSRLLELLGLVNYRIVTGNRVFIQVGGIVYRALLGVYWRSVFSGVEHYLLRCEEISGWMWAEERGGASVVDLPITHTENGWTAKGQSLTLMLHLD